MATAEKRATLIQLIDLWRSPKSGNPEASEAARAMSKEECEEVVACLVLGGMLQFDFGGPRSLSSHSRRLPFLLVSHTLAHALILFRIPLPYLCPRTLFSLAHAGFTAYSTNTYLKASDRGLAFLSRASSNTSAPSSAAAPSSSSGGGGLFLERRRPPQPPSDPDEEEEAAACSGLGCGPGRLKDLLAWSR